MKTIVHFLLTVCLAAGGFLVPGTPLSAQDERGLDIGGAKKITDKQGKEVILYKESHALVIGVSNYTDWPKLPGVQKDVQEVKAILETHGFNVVVKLDLDKTTLEQAFNEFITTYGRKPDNRLLFYFAGHGHTHTFAYGDEMGYIVPVDASVPRDDEAGFLAKAIDMQMIEVYARRIESKHALFVFDSCFSGSLFVLSRAVPEIISYKTAQPVRQFITSGSANEFVPDESIFRAQFTRALQGEADSDQDGYVTGTELGEFLQTTVVNYSRNAQHPQYGKIRNPKLDKGDFVFQLPGAVYIKQTIVTEAPEVSSSVDPETAMWKLIEHSDTIQDVKDFLAAYPEGKFAKVAQLKLRQLERQQPTTVWGKARWGNNRWQ